MRKNIAVLFSMIIFICFSFLGCSNDSISKVEVLDNTIQTNYIIGEEININEFDLKITLKNKKEKIYEISKEMIEFGEIDNTVLGTQPLNVYIDYNGMKFEIIVSIKFDLPDDAKAIISLIEELENKDIISFDDEKEIELIDRKYNALNSEYKKYITNYDSYEEIKNELNELKNTYITSDFINERFILKTNVDNLFNTLSKTKYTQENWNKIVKIYDDCISSLYKNSNHEYINTIAVSAINEIKNIPTIKETEVEFLKEEKKELLKVYYEKLNLDQYSESNKEKIAVIVSNFNIIVETLQTTEKIENYYNSILLDINNVPTITDEKTISLNNYKDSALNEVKKILLDMKISNYSESNKKIILEHYNDCLNKIRNSNDINIINKDINIFKYNVSKLKTLVEEKAENLNAYKIEITEKINLFAKSINLYEYDSQNKGLIEIAIKTANNDIKVAASIEEIQIIEDNLISYVETIPTLLMQATANLPNKIKDANDKIDSYVSSLEKNKFSKENWDKIIAIAANAKEYFEKNISIATSSTTITNKIASFIEKINSIVTIEEKTNSLIIDAKVNANSTLDEYYNSLDSNDFENLSMDLIKNRIEDSKKRIESLETIESINKLVENTINIIEQAKK